MNTNNNNESYYSPKQIIEDPAFNFITLPMLRYYLLHRQKNGLAAAVRKIGSRKLVIRRDLFILWIEKQIRNLK
jgi:hypothetical protein